MGPGKISLFFCCVSLCLAFEAESRTPGKSSFPAPGRYLLIPSPAPVPDLPQPTPTPAPADPELPDISGDEAVDEVEAEEPDSPKPPGSPAPGSPTPTASPKPPKP